MERIDGGRVPADSPPYTVAGWVHDDAHPDAAPHARRAAASTAMAADPRARLAGARARLPRQAAVRLARLRAAAPLLRGRVRVGRRGRRSSRPSAPRSSGSARNAADRRTPRSPCAGATPASTTSCSTTRYNVAAVARLGDGHARRPDDGPRVVAVPRPPLPRGHARGRASRASRPARRWSRTTSEVRGRAAHDLEFYEMFAGLRFAVVMMRIKSLLVEFELMPADSDMGRNNIVTHCLAELLGLPAPGELTCCQWGRDRRATPTRSPGASSTRWSGCRPRPATCRGATDLRPLLKDAESLGGFQHPASYMFKNLPDARFADDPPRRCSRRWTASASSARFIGVTAENDHGAARHRRAPRPVRPARPTSTRTRAWMACARCGARSRSSGVKAAAALPSARSRSVPSTTPQWYPLYAACIDLGIPFCPCMGVPGPRVPFAPQHVMGLDRVCYEFPELVIVTRHGCEPWEELAVKLMLKWPNLTTRRRRSPRSTTRRRSSTTRTPAAPTR